MQYSGLQIEAVELISSTLPIFIESAKRKFRELEDNSKMSNKQMMNQDCFAK
jgi:hypothetical protein